MNQEAFTDAVVNAETAFSSQNYELALEWFKKALDENPNDVSVLARAGTVCVPLEKYEESLEFFQKALELDPENGDNYFNLGNAYFFKGDFVKSLELYADAEIKGVSDDVKPKMYYQMALLCSIRQDPQASLANFKKYEDADPTKTAALDPDVISEKIKVYLMAEDYDGAEKCAVQWVGIDPTNVSSYMVYFNILMAKSDYKKAEQIMEDVEKYATLNDTFLFNIRSEKITLLTAKADAVPENKETIISSAIDLTKSLIEIAPPIKKRELTLVLAELYMKLDKFDKAIYYASSLVKDTDINKFTAGSGVELDYAELGDAEIDYMADEDVRKIDEMISSGELDDNLGEYAEVYYDENGNEVREYPDDVFADIMKDEIAKPVENDSAVKPVIEDAEKTADDYFDRLCFVLLSCYVTIEDYKNAHKFGGLLKNSNIVYYSYFGRYTEAFSEMKLPEYTQEQTEQKYAETNAFFRTAMLEKKGVMFAAIFRARMYAEMGKFAKAEEMAKLLMPDEKSAVLDYINECRKELS